MHLTHGVALYIPDIGWIDLDPTNNLIPAVNHITLAWGPRTIQT